MPEESLIFLKLGGSLITDKDSPRTPRPEVIGRLAEEIAQAMEEDTTLRVVLGHGSGSFGHNAARRHGTRNGVRDEAGWKGFAEVWKDARALNQMVVEALAGAGLPVIAFPPSAAVIAHDGKAAQWDLSAMRAALARGLLPLINGDTIFDAVRGGTILSTEDLFFYLARQLRPQRILLAGIEDGVWADFPARQNRIAQITPQNYPALAAQIGGSASVDVTGGMLEKVRAMLALAQDVQGLQSWIFSAGEAGVLRAALLGSPQGTVVLDSE